MPLSLFTGNKRQIRSKTEHSTMVALSKVYFACIKTEPNPVHLVWGRNHGVPSHPRSRNALRVLGGARLGTGPRHAAVPCDPPSSADTDGRRPLGGGSRACRRSLDARLSKMAGVARALAQPPGARIVLRPRTARAAYAPGVARRQLRERGRGGDLVGRGLPRVARMDA